MLIGRPRKAPRVGVYVITYPGGRKETFGVLSATFASMSERDAAGVRYLEKGRSYTSNAHGWTVTRKS